MSTAADPILSAAESSLARVRAEIRLLACIAPLGRWGLALASRAGITIDAFTADDCRCIYAGLIVAERTGRITDAEATVQLCRDVLITRHLWHPDDTRSFCGGMTWGPGPLAALFTSLSHREAEELLPILVAELLAMEAGHD